MKKLRLGIICGFMAIALTLMGCTSSSPTLSVNELKDLLVEQAPPAVNPAPAKPSKLTKLLKTTATTKTATTGTATTGTATTKTATPQGPSPVRSSVTKPQKSAAKPSSYPAKPSQSSEPGVNTDNVGPDLGYLPDNYYDTLAERPLTPAEQEGLQTWYFWTGGNDAFFRNLAKESEGTLDFFALLDARPDQALAPGDRPHLQRNVRFKEIGVINDPGCKAATKPDRYGLWFDQCGKDPYASGIMGARKFKNPNFDPGKWDVDAYYRDGAQVEPPYRIGLSCGICHIAFNPNNPPKNPTNPKWSNIAAAIGNQYIREGGLFGRNLPEDDFTKQVVDRQPPGTSDTSRNAPDHIDNPTTINAIFNLGSRPTFEETLANGQKKTVYHILKDGADSVGINEAGERVYVNIGVCSEEWLKHFDLVTGLTAQTPFPKAKAETPGTCFNDFYIKTTERSDNMGAYLATVTPYHLKDAPGGKKYLTRDKKQLERGKVLFAQNCAQCHSSKQPPKGLSGFQQREWYRDSVLKRDFLDDNFLSTDVRYPVTEIGTNASRALGTNATQGHIWNDYSSKTYKQQPSPGTLTLENPFDKTRAIEYDIPEGGVGYYRVPSLISLWTSAPFLNNNSLGKYTGDPSVAGRMAAFNDAVEKLLWPEQRDHVIKRTSKDSILRLERLGLGSAELEVPKGTPIKLLANLDGSQLPSLVRRKLESPTFAQVLSKVARRIPERKMVPLLLKQNTAPDFVEDRGHLFGTQLPNKDKKALIEFLKTF